MHYNVTVNNPLAAISPSAGSVQLTAANGDTIFTTIIGQGEPADGMPGFAHITEHNTITGGTGRFAGAQFHCRPFRGIGAHLRFIPGRDHFPGAAQ
jgi:hypothetical protein